MSGAAGTGKSSSRPPRGGRGLKSLGWVFASSGITSPSPLRVSPQVTDEGICRAFSPHLARERATFSPREKAFPCGVGSPRPTWHYIKTCPLARTHQILRQHSPPLTLRKTQQGGSATAEPPCSTAQRIKLPRSSPWCRAACPTGCRSACRTIFGSARRCVRR